MKLGISGFMKFRNVRALGMYGPGALGVEGLGFKGMWSLGTQGLRILGFRAFGLTDRGSYRGEGKLGVVLGLCV